MLQGQVKKALSIVDTTNDIDGKYDITGDIIKKLKEQHPKAEKIKQSTIIPVTKTENVIFENIAQEEIVSSSKC